MRARLSDWQIADGDIAVPVPGEVIDHLPLRLLDTVMVDARGDQPVQRVEGTVSWARHDEMNGVLETRIVAGSFSVLTQEPAAAGDPVPVVGASVRRSGYLCSVGSYEFDEVDGFDLPEVTQSWRVIAVEPLGHDLLVDLEAVEIPVEG